MMKTYFWRFCLLFGVITYSSASLIGRCNRQCPEGQVCVRIAVQCARAPCPPIEQCVDNSGEPIDVGGRFEKPGDCPAPIPGRFGICIAQCTFDDECEGSLKCCGSCPRACTLPVFTPPVEKPGRCPPYRFGFIGSGCRRYYNECRSDGQCDGMTKCCPGDCGARCQRPFLDTDQQIGY